MSTTGKIKVNSDNLMPIIKKWLYSDKDIFLRELVSNATDAISKHKKLVAIGEANESNDEYAIKIQLDKDNKTLTISDNGIGMTSDEVTKYIAEVAFSGASDFVEKYSKTNGDGIIGHFGLGFYSAYMVSSKVVIESLSYLPDSKAVYWESDGVEDYEIDESDKTTRGTSITLHLNEEDKDFAELFTIKSLLNKYCNFMPYPIYVEEIGEKKEEKEGEPATPVSINNTTPLYLKDPKECTDEEYEQFYKDTFHDFNPPLFWVHLNVDYPFNLKGILYFPKAKNTMEDAQGEVKLYCNQVFIADNIKEVIPEFLLLLKGVIDCPDIPLNVSRSFLQNDREVAKISKHITKKVADKLTSLFNTDREKLQNCWADINPFIKFGCIKNEDFYSKVENIILYQTINDEYVTLNELCESKGDIFYVSDKVAQAQYIKLFKDNNLNAVVLPHFIDSHFMTFVEYKNKDVKFKRVDAELPESLQGGDTIIDKDKIVELFKSAIANDNIKVETTTLQDTNIPAIILSTEQSRRMLEMSKQYGGMFGDFKEDITIKLNLNNKSIASITELEGNNLNNYCKYVLLLATLSNRQLTQAEMQDFLALSYTMLNK